MQRTMEEESERLANSIETNQNETEQTKKMFKKIQEPVDHMVAMFKRSKFSLAVATQMDYDEGFQFTENNIVAYLAELEEYINTLIVYMAFKRDDPNAAIAAIPFESLNTKDFKKKDTTLENPPEHTFGLTLM